MPQPLPMSFISNLPSPCETKGEGNSTIKEKKYTHPMSSTAVVWAKSHFPMGPSEHSLVLQMRPRTSRNFKITRPVKGRAGLEPRLPDSQARTSHSPVLFSRFFQTKDFQNLLSPSRHPTPQHKGAAHQVSVPLALGVGLLLSSPAHPSPRTFRPLRVWQALSPRPTIQRPHLCRQHKRLRTH